MLKVTLVLAFCVITTNVHSARVLAVLPIPSVSFHKVFNSLIQEIIAHGHEVVVITTNPAFQKGEAPTNLTEIDIHDVSYKTWSELFKYDAIGGKDDLVAQIKNIFEAIDILMGVQLQIKEVNDVILKKYGKFDLLLLDACATTALLFTHVYKIPTVQISTMGDAMFTNKVAGAPTHPILFPSPWSQKVYNLTKWEKMYAIYNHFWLQWLWDTFEDQQDKLVKRVLGPNVPHIRELKNNVDMWFLNVNYIWADNQPLPPNVLYVGGLQLRPTKELPQDLQSYLDASKNGVIYVSFGTNVKPHLLNKDMIDILMKVLSQQPYDILIKWDPKHFEVKAINMKVQSFFPQADLLRHPKIKLFITQCGLHSTDEAVRAGVPLLGIPVFTDQWYNANKYVHHKIGLTLDIETLTEEQLRTAINTVITDVSYRKNIIKLRTLVEDQPQTSLERAVWWMEHLMRHGGGQHLRPPTANISWAQYLEVEIIVILISCSLVTMAVLVLVMYCIFSLFCKKSKKIKSKAA